MTFGRGTVLLFGGQFLEAVETPCFVTGPASKNDTPFVRDDYIARCKGVVIKRAFGCPTSGSLL